MPGRLQEPKRLYCAVLVTTPQPPRQVWDKAIPTILSARRCGLRFATPSISSALPRQFRQGRLLFPAGQTGRPTLLDWRRIAFPHVNTRTALADSAGVRNFKKFA